MTDLGDFKKSLCATAAMNRGGIATVNQGFDFTKAFLKAADDAMASTTTADTVMWTNPYDFPVYVTAARYLPTGTITGDDTNNATITVKTNDGAGGSTATAASIQTTVATGNFSANQSKAMTVTVANAAVVASGGNLWINIAKTGSGVVVRAGMIEVRLRKAE